MDRIYTFDEVRSPLRYDPLKVGAVELRHDIVKKGGSMTVVSVREAMFSGEQAQSIRVKKPIVIHQLLENGSLWMSDCPQEVREARKVVRDLGPCRGARVLVGGLGIGLIARLLSDAGAIVTVVEINPAIIELIKAASDGPLPYDVVTADIYHYLKTLTMWGYDFAFFDTWRGNNEGEWWDSVFPLRRILGQKFGRKPSFLCWQEETMLGQILHRLTSSVPPHWHYKAELNLPMTHTQATRWIKSIGLPSWERKYGSAYAEGTA